MEHSRARDPALTRATHVASLEDRRVPRSRRHPLLRIVTSALGAVSGGAERWQERAAFGAARAAWFAACLDLPHGIPADDPFHRLVAALDPAPFRACCATWVRSVAAVVPAQVVALDGKTRRRSHDRAAGNAALPLVRAWATANRLLRHGRS